MYNTGVVCVIENILTLIDGMMNFLTGSKKKVHKKLIPKHDFFYSGKDTEICNVFMYKSEKLEAGATGYHIVTIDINGEILVFQKHVQYLVKSRSKYGVYVQKRKIVFDLTKITITKWFQIIGIGGEDTRPKVRHYRFGHQRAA